MATDGRTERGDRTRAALLEASMELIARDGVASATQRSVAAAAGASLASTTYHFGTRAELLVATLEHAAELAVAEIDGLAARVRSKDLDPVDACLGYIARQRSGQSATAIVVFELALAAAREPRLRAANTAFLESLRQLFAPFTPHGAALAQSFYGLLLLELARGSEPSPELETTIREIFAAFEVSAP